MSFFLRKISRAKWDPNLQVDSASFTADAITGCNRTNENKLSVWLSESKDLENEQVEKLIVALATTMEKPAPLDILWLDPVWLRDNGFEVEENIGKTRYASVNHLHRDIAQLNHSGLAAVGSHIVSQINSDNHHRVIKSDLIKLVYKWMKADGDFRVEDLDEKWHPEIYKYEKRLEQQQSV
jgi:hypothetical protein